MSWFEFSSAEFPHVFFWIGNIEKIPDFPSIWDSESLDCNAIKEFTGRYNTDSTNTSSCWFISDDIIERGWDASRPSRIGRKRKAA